MSLDVKWLAAMMRMQAASTFISTLEGTDSQNGMSPLGTEDNSFSSLLESILADSNLNSSTNEITSFTNNPLTALQPLLQRPGTVLQPHLTHSRTSAELSQPLNQLIDETAHKYGVDAALVKGLIQQESGFNSTAVSSAGAQGLMQLMPETAIGLGVTNPFDPVQNIDAGVRHLKGLLERYAGNTSLALAAYNAGAGNVDRYNGIPPFAETQAYVRNVLALAKRYA